MRSKQIEKILPFVQKPARYTGGEPNSVVKEKTQVDVRFAFCFPDKYEIGMSHLGMKILYGLLNEMPGVWCERCFAPDIDMEEIMRTEGIELFALESGDALKDFDFIGFTLQYEMCYTNVLNMLSLAGIPLLSKDREGLQNIVIMGGPCVCNPEPIADFADVICLGEGEELLPEVVECYRRCKQNGESRAEFLRKAAQIEGVYIPSFYEVEYYEDNTVKEVIPKYDFVPATVKKRVVADLDKMYFPETFVVPFVQAVHDRATAEVFRGCIRGCRFCQAGFIYRPIREKSSETVRRQSNTLCENTGYEELSLCSLSTSDYSDIETLLSELIDDCEAEKVNLSLPSLRVDNFSESLAEKLAKVRRSGLTFAPEAGTQRLRDAINKNVSEEELMNTCRKAFLGGWTLVKLYFMMGLPTETEEDVAGISALADKVAELFYQLPDRPKGRNVSINVSCASFIPKPFTPFQWEAADDSETLERKKEILLSANKSKRVSISYNNSTDTLIEAVLAKGSRKLCPVVLQAFQNGCKFDSWDEYFNYEGWQKAFESCGVDPKFFANRKIPFDEVLPWDHLDYSIRKDYLISENKKAHESITSPHCRQKCAACGADKLSGGVCHARSKA
ncbi:MAG: TIGR03960 family B12-binding radical SAM protein [Clostridia bacterium]|nr:TIGR03960 family B12-binding radical SAM protein [Clostridia bacterium]